MNGYTPARMGSGPKMSPEIRARLQIAKQRMGVGSANDAVGRLLDFWEERTGQDSTNGMHSSNGQGVSTGE